MHPTVIVFESRPRWGPELQRQFLHQEITVRASRSLDDLEALAGKSPHAAALIDLDAAPAACVQFLGRRLGRSPYFPVVAVGSPRMAELEWPLRELGAVSVLCDFPTGEQMATLCRRLFASAPFAS